jgi:hypothetical protein
MWIFPATHLISRSREAFVLRNKPAPPRASFALTRWEIIGLKATLAQLVGHVFAADEQAALKSAIEQFHIREGRPAAAIRQAHMTERRRFPPPWTVDEATENFCIRDSNGQAPAYVYYEDAL